MRILSVALLACLLALPLGGCSKGKEGTKGGPGGEAAKAQKETGGPTDKGTREAAKDSFSVVVPSSDVDVTQGDTNKNVTISVDRGKNFDQKVTLTFKPDPGITIDPKETVIAKGDTKVHVAITAAADAKPGTHSVDVTGAADTGGAKSEAKFGVNVKKK